MKIRYKIVITGIAIILIIWFLWSPSFFGQPECRIIMNGERGCRTLSNWDWFYYVIFEIEFDPFEQTMASHCPQLALRQFLGLDLDRMCL